MKYNYICETMDVIYWFAVSGEHQWMFGNVVRNGTPWYTQNPITPYLLGHCLLHASMASHWVNEVWFLLLGLPTEGLKSICYVYIYIYICLLFMDMNGGMVRSTFWGASKDILHLVSQGVSPYLWTEPAQPPRIAANCRLPASTFGPTNMLSTC